MVLGLHGLVGGGAPVPFWCLPEKCQGAKISTKNGREKVYDMVVKY